MNILISPVISEKSMANAQNSKFTFFVSDNANKNEIKKEVEKKFGVKVLDVATLIVKGRSKRVGKKRTVKTLRPFKKAIVKIVKGQKIELFDLGEKKK